MMPIDIKSSLKREIGLFGATSYGVGIILGAGIYALIGPAAGIAGNSVWISFIIGALISSFTGLSYAELSAMFMHALETFSFHLFSSVDRPRCDSDELNG